jgi:hypothetical protein
MAIMLPDLIREATTSAAERRLFMRLRRELPPTCRVLHSLGLAAHPTKLAGEADFVIASPLGVFVIEVKGGRVACKDGKWQFIRGDGLWSEKAEGPFAQANSAMFHLRELAEQERELRHLLWGYGVVMPDETFTATGPEIVQGALLDHREYERPLDEYLERLSRYWSEHFRDRHRHISLPSATQIEKLARLMRPDTSSSVTVGKLLAGVERLQAELTDEQARILQRLNLNPRTEIHGAAGTGKTFLALDFSSRLAAAGRRVLYLCFNRLLGEHVKGVLREAGPGIVADSLHSWFGEVIARAGMSGQLAGHEGGELFNDVYPAVFEQAAVELEMEPFDYLVIDEGQDLLRSRYMDALDLVLAGGLERGRWHVFLDPMQAIFTGGVEDAVTARLEDCGRAVFQLTVNCRNSREVAIESAIVSQVDVPLEGAVEGGVVREAFLPADRDGRLAALESAVRDLLDAGLGEQDLIILSSRSLEASGLQGHALAGRPLRDLTCSPVADALVQGRAGAIDFCTMQAFKGLERRAVVAWRLDDLETTRFLHYCGLTRARTWLTVLFDHSERAAYERLATDFGRRIAGKASPRGG